MDTANCPAIPCGEEPSVASEQVTGQTVLVVEDNEVERAGLEAVLGQEGYAVVTAQTADEGLERLRAGGIDLVLLDMMLSGRDGWYFLSRRQREPQAAGVPVIVTTGLEVASLEWAASLGASACFRKPFPVAALLREVRRLCGAARQ
jgi:twitching motility two-component system response regulator PilH